MNPSYSTRYKKMVGGRQCIGFRLNLRKLSIRRLRVRFIRFFRLLQKRFFSRILPSSATATAFGSCCSKRSGELNKASVKNRCESGEYCRIRSLVRSNSFYSEAIADCLEFIKRSSGASSVDGISAEIPADHLTSPPVGGLNSG